MFKIKKNVVENHDEMNDQNKMMDDNHAVSWWSRMHRDNQFHSDFNVCQMSDLSRSS